MRKRLNRTIAKHKQNWGQRRISTFSWLHISFGAILKCLALLAPTRFLPTIVCARTVVNILGWYFVTNINSPQLFVCLLAIIAKSRYSHETFFDRIQLFIHLSHQLIHQNASNQGQCLKKKKRNTAHFIYNISYFLLSCGYFEEWKRKICENKKYVD